LKASELLCGRDGSAGAEYFDVGAGARVRRKLLVVKAGTVVELSELFSVEPFYTLSAEGCSCFEVATDRGASTAGGCLISGERLKPLWVNGRVENVRV